MEAKFALITGARGGIGKSLVEAFARSGYSIIACTRKPDREFDAFVEDISTCHGTSIIQAHFDMIDTESMKVEIKRVLKNVGHIDVLVNNAGIAHGALFSMTRVQDIRDVFNTNLFSHMELTQLVMRSMIRHKSGNIINMSSVAAVNLRAGNSAYGVSKAAVKAWTETLSVELAPFGIRVNAIAPSLTDTNMAKSMEDKAGKEMLAASAMNRLAHPEEIANVAVYLASEQASFINGQTIIVNGGGR